jgi:hypothetical protein
MKSPPKREGACSNAPTPKLTTGLPGAYHRPALVQSGIIWKRWEREARRLFIEFWRSGDAKHLFAFAAHVTAMRGYTGRRK